MLEEGYTYEKPVDAFYKPKGNPSPDPVTDKMVKSYSRLDHVKDT